MILAIVLVLLIWALWFAAPYIRRWLVRRSMNYVQDKMYRSMGIDPEAVKKARRQQEQAARQSRRQSSRQAHGNRREGRYRSGKIIPSDYGEPVSFTQLAITGTELWLTDTDKSPVYKEYATETQITDVRYTQLK